jgi:ATP-binding cassette subfamily B protein
MNPPRGRGHGPGHGPGPGAPVEKAKDFKGSMKSLLKYIGRYKIAILVVILFAIGSTIFNVVGPKILGNATTELFNGVMSKYTGGSGIDFGKIAGILIWLICIYITSAVFGFVQNFVMSTVTQKVGYRLRRDISYKINLLPMNFFDKKQTGEILSIVTNDVDTLCTSLNQVATQAVTSVSTIIGVLYMMFSIDWLMTLVALVILPVSVMFIAVIFKISQKHFRNQQDYLGHVNGQVEETIGGVDIVQAFNTQDRNKEEFEKSNDMLYKSAWKSQFLSGLMGPVMQFIGNMAYVAVAVLGGYLAIQGTITVGNIQSFIQYVRQFTQPIQQLAQVSNMMQQMAASAERIFEFIKEEEEPQFAENHCKNEKGENVTYKDISGDVTFDHVRFGYNPDKIIVNDFSAKVKQGQKIAIVGPTGAGKTTMVKLLMRFYDLNGGHILVDGYDIDDFDRRELRELYGMVLQDTWLFTGTIMENIRYGKLDATDEEVIEATKTAHVHSFVKHLPDGYNMMLNEETSNVSQGQKQLLTIARTILADPKILILDEATSSVDTRTEVRIQKAMDNLMKGRTSFIIAHRLSTIRDADLILFMKDGDIVEQGNHQELLAKGGYYADLYNSQFDKVG